MTVIKSGVDAAEKWTVLSFHIPKVEGFTSKPFWDYKQWTWGYGTAAGFNKAVNPGGTITRVKAFADMLAHLKADEKYLQPKFKVDLNAKQWAAVLSYAYNAGAGAAAENLVSAINLKDKVKISQGFRTRMTAGGVPSAVLKNRREVELKLFYS